MPSIFFVTHPEVVIDPAMPVPRWPLSEKGRRRMGLFISEALAGRDVGAVWSSDEQKAMDGGAIVAESLGVAHEVDAELAENDRSSTGYIAPPEFWEVVDQFFARPDDSVRGWARARDEQDRIVRAVARVATAGPAGRDVVIVSHGGVGRLLAAHLQSVEIGQEETPQHPGGGCWLEIDRETLAITRSWTSTSD